jgi:hypothetical protein
VKIPRSRDNKEGFFVSMIQAVKSMLIGFKVLLSLPDMDGAVSCGAGIALSVFIPYFLFFVSSIPSITTN